MEAVDVNPTFKPAQVLASKENYIPLKSPNKAGFAKEKAEAEAPQDKSFKEDRGRTKKSIRSYKIVELQDSSGEFVSVSAECPVNGNDPAAHTRCENDQFMKLNDYHRQDAGSKSLVAKSNAPFATDPTVLTGHEEDISEPVIQDTHGLIKQRKRNNLKKSAKRPRICEQEGYDNLEAKVQELKNENSMHARNLGKIANQCEQIRRQNDLLLDELKWMCRSDIISVLEAKNPDQSRRSVADHEPSDQSIDTPSTNSGSSSNFTLSDCSKDTLSSHPDARTTFD